jgi:hypothetical protein
MPFVDVCWAVIQGTTELFAISSLGHAVLWPLSIDENREVAEEFQANRLVKPCAKIETTENPVGRNEPKIDLFAWSSKHSNRRNQNRRMLVHLVG